MTLKQVIADIDSFGLLDLPPIGLVERRGRAFGGSLSGRHCAEVQGRGEGLERDSSTLLQSDSRMDGGKAQSIIARPQNDAIQKHLTWPAKAADC